jgi:hypothetical protein
VRRNLADVIDRRLRIEYPEDRAVNPGRCYSHAGEPTTNHCKEQAMCYEERYFSEWAKKTARKREETRSATEQRKPDARPDRPKQEPTKPEEVERELEAV